MSKDNELLEALKSALFLLSKPQNITALEVITRTEEIKRIIKEKELYETTKKTGD